MKIAQLLNHDQEDSFLFQSDTTILPEPVELTTADILNHFDTQKLILCRHGIRDYYCKPCGGKGICIHDRVKTLCEDCVGNCDHGSLPSKCVVCKLCEHRKPKLKCKECKRKSVHQCKDCISPGICVKNTRSCLACSGSGVLRNKTKNVRCFECDGLGVSVNRRSQKYNLNYCATM